MHRSDLWFILIATLWTGYFVLEGFDFGIGILLPVLGRNDTERRVLINTIGPVWDGNETWLVTAGGATFASFPAWYASMFSAFYLPLLVIVAALIVRGLAFEYRGKGDTLRWRAWWDTAIFVGSLLPAILWGVVFGNILHGIRLDAAHNYVDSFTDLLNPYALLGGLTTLTLFVAHGAVFAALKTNGGIRDRARRLAGRTGVAAIAATAGFLAWTETSRSGATAAAASIAFLSSFVLELAATLSVALVAVGVGLGLVYGHLDLRTGLLVLILAPEAYLPLRQVAAQYHAAADGLAAAGEVFAVLETDEPVSSSARSAAPDPVLIRVEELSVTHADRALRRRAR